MDPKLINSTSIIACQVAVCKGDRRGSIPSKFSKYCIDRAQSREAVKEVVNAVIGQESLLRIFGPKNKGTQEQYKSLFENLGIISETKKGTFSQNYNLMQIEKFLNRVLTLPFVTQKQIINWLKTATDRVAVVRKFEKDIKG